MGASPSWKVPPWAVGPMGSEADVWRCLGRPSEPREERLPGPPGHLGTWAPGLGTGMVCGWEGDGRRKTQKGHGSGTTGLSLSPAGMHCSPPPRT